MLSAMRYKDFIWPHNPRTFHVLWQRRVAVLDAPGGRFHVQELGKTCRILRGEGEFCGATAYEDFERLVRTFRQDGAGTLVHPIWRSDAVYFTRLELTQEPRQDYVAYAFEFTETRSIFSGALRREFPVSGKELYRVQSGDTFWSIAARFALDGETLLQLNPQIANPNLLSAGQEVRVG